MDRIKLTNKWLNILTNILFSFNQHHYNQHWANTINQQTIKSFNQPQVKI